ncbi:MAG: 6-phosphogluconolactonase, partial [candidate division NC10 bacterium]
MTVLNDSDALAEAAARLVVEAAAEAIAARGRFTIALAGGETPRATYARLAKPPFSDRVDWSRTWVFFGDERGVPPEHADSNYGMAHATLLAKV